MPGSAGVGTGCQDGSLEVGRGCFGAEEGGMGEDQTQEEWDLWSRPMPYPNHPPCQPGITPGFLGLR